MRRAVFGITILVVLCAGAALAWLHLASQRGSFPDHLEPFGLSERPQADRYLFDYVGILGHFEEGLHRYLERLASRFQIEAVIVTVPAIPPGRGLETLAVDLVNNWRIGQSRGGRGLLLLMVDETKQVKLEVGYALEAVFTDSLSGYVEDTQLGPNFRSGDLGTGLIAVMEMLERRAQLEGSAEHARGSIEAADALLLAGGAGASRQLTSHETGPAAPARGATGRGARSPEEAWQIMLAKWGGEGDDIPVDVYTRMTRLAMGDPNQPDPRTVNWLDHWRGADFEVRRHGEHAVVWFGAVDGWENAPFLFCNTGDGWRFDIVWQRRLVVMSSHPKWQVAQGPYPYVALMQEARQSTGKDLPLGREDLYRCADDGSIATRMQTLSTVVEREPDNVDALVELMRLQVNTNQRPNRVRPLIDRAKQLAPHRVEPWKYSALYNITAFFQYETALRDVERVIELHPDDAFGHQLKGFVLYRLGRYQQAVSALEVALDLSADDGYSYALLSRVYALMVRNASAVNKERYRQDARSMRDHAARLLGPESQRLLWLDRWLERRL